MHSSLSLRRLRFLRSILPIVIALCCASSCKIADAHTYNLRVLHEETGRHKRMAGLMSDSSYSFQSFFWQGLLRKTKAQFENTEPSKVDDPLESCVENLIELWEIDPVDETGAAQQVENFARYAVLDPWQISRQICVRALGAAGARLKLGEHADPQPQGAIATPDDVRAALALLLRAVGPQKTGEAAADLAAACQGMAGLNYDFDGLLRALPASAFLLRREKSDSPRRKLLLELVQSLERRTLRIALERAGADSSPWVRGLALEALVRANGKAYLAKELPRLGTEPEAEVQLSLLSMIRSLGLPAAAAAGADPSQSEREGGLALVYKVATQHPIERVRVSAMATLGAVSGAGFESLREEDWQTWWQARTQSAAR